MGQLATDRFGCSGRRVPANLFLLLGFRSLSRFSHGRVHVTGWRFFLLVFVKTAFLVLLSLRFVRGLDLLSSTPGITVVVGFPFIASPESPCASETLSLFLAVNGRTSTAPSRPERGSLAHCQARILQWPTNRLSQFRPVTWSESLLSSHGDRLIRGPLNSAKSHIENITVREDRSYHQEQPKN